MRWRVVLGSTLLMLGFIIYQLGITMLIAPGSHLSDLVKKFIIPLLSNQTPEMITVTLQYGGGIIAVIGLITAIKGMSSNGEIRALKSSIHRLESTIQNLQTSQHKTQTSQSNCKFCGENISANDSFCPRCGRAQT
ncbi:MAG: hypothetical protein QXN62_08285 [Candidatus Bathyarchaeia archaeon]|nr:hypothetical protein [Candidatus Bathyarchaeota archaeon]